MIDGVEIDALGGFGGQERGNANLLGEWNSHWRRIFAFVLSNQDRFIDIRCDAIWW